MDAGDAQSREGASGVISDETGASPPGRVGEIEVEDESDGPWGWTPVWEGDEEEVSSVGGVVKGGTGGRFDLDVR